MRTFKPVYTAMYGYIDVVQANTDQTKWKLDTQTYWHTLDKKI